MEKDPGLKATKEQSRARKRTRPDVGSSALHHSLSIALRRSFEGTPRHPVSVRLVAPADQGHHRHGLAFSIYSCMCSCVVPKSHTWAAYTNRHALPRSGGGRKSAMKVSAGPCFLGGCRGSAPSVAASSGILRCAHAPLRSFACTRHAPRCLPTLSCLPVLCPNFSFIKTTLLLHLGPP